MQHQEVIDQVLKIATRSFVDRSYTTYILESVAKLPFGIRKPKSFVGFLQRIL